MTHDTTRAGDQGQEPGGPYVEVNNQRFRVRTAHFATPWLPDTLSHRHLLVVWCRLLVDDQGKPLFTLQELTTLVGSTNRQAACQPLDDVRQCGEDMRAFVLCQRKVDTTVVEGVLHALLQTPLAGSTEVLAEVKPVGTLEGRGCSLRSAIGIRWRPILRDPLHARMRLEPIGQGRRGTIREKRHRPVALQIDQHRAIALACPQGKIVHIPEKERLRW